MAGGGNDRLSELPNDLLRRILHFAPLREAASTTLLSRRWRTRPRLWSSSGAVNLETGKICHYYDNPRFFTQRDGFVSAATAALDAAVAPVTRLTLRLNSDLHQQVGDFHTWYRDATHDKVVSRYTDLVDVALSHRAARRRGVEELRIAAKDPNNYYSYSRDESQSGYYTVTLDSMQLETLRVLELTHCRGLLYQREQAAAISLPRLSSLRLSNCVQHLSSLQRIIDASPALADIRLVYVRVDATHEEAKEGATACRLRCPVATVLVLDSCTWTWEEECQGRHHYKKTVDVHVVEIDAPRLHRFRYKGSLRSFSFSPQPPDLEQVDLDFSEHVGENGKTKDPDRDLATFWRLARSFTDTKELRLTVNHLEDIAVLSEARRVELLPAFGRLERLEVQGAYSTNGKDAAMTVLNILRCCPVLSALRINLAADNKIKNDASKKKVVGDTRIPQKEIQIAALAQCHLIQCLQSSLRRVGLLFRLEKSNCLGGKLIKFFAENAMILKEMYIDGGDNNLCKHMNPKTEKWNSKRRKSGATTFVVLPLKR